MTLIKSDSERLIKQLKEHSNIIHTTIIMMLEDKIDWMGYKDKDDVF